MTDQSGPAPQTLAELVPLGGDIEGKEPETLNVTDNPIADQTLGAFDLAVVVESVPASKALLRIPLPDPVASGIAPETIRFFHVTDGAPPRPVWSSGYAPGVGTGWAIIREPGTYVPIGLPRDRLIEEALREQAIARRLGGERGDALRTLLEGPDDAIADLRRFVTTLELDTGTERPRPNAMERRTGGHLDAYLLPGGVGLDAFRKRVAGLKYGDDGLPEEALFFPPDPPSSLTPPWQLAGDRLDWDGIEPERITLLESILERFPIGDTLRPIPWPFPWLWSKNWWMYQHDRKHTGRASGPSDITRTSVNRLKLVRTLPVNGPVISKPAIVNGAIYIGSGRQGGGGGTLYKFDLVTGTKLGEFPTSGSAYYGWVNGVGGSPAVTGGRVYFTGVHGKVYCLDASTMTPSAPHPAPIWETDLNVASVAKNQPVNQPNADSWSGPLVVGNRVFIGCGEGEDANTYGFVYCLDANTGRVNWLFCTAKFGGVANNAPNMIPSAIAAWWAAGAGFSVTANAPETGSAVWSSCAYDSTLDRIYVGTGNSEYNSGVGGIDGTAQPDDPYGSGLIALDASTGAFKGFFQPTPDDCYWPGDSDIDVPGSPTVVNRGSDRVVAFGSKNGSFFLLDPDTLAPVARRQMLPRIGGTGVPGNRGTGVPAIVPTGGSGENSWGIFGTPAVHAESGRLFVGIGGYNGAAPDAGAGIDATRTPFVRAVNWNSLLDAWPTAVGGDGISRYTTAKPPLYTSREVGLSSPAVVNDVVFVSTDKAAMYALDVDNGQCLWSAPGLPTSGFTFALGPAIYGNYVVMGVGANVYVYRLGWRFPFEPWRIPIEEIILYPKPWPPPPPDPPWWWRDPDRITVTQPLLAALIIGALLIAAIVVVAVAALVLA